MVTVNVICVGKLKEEYLRAACLEYTKRLGAFCRVNIVELSEYKLPTNPSAAEIAQGIEAEGDAILHKLTGYVVALCIEGKLLSSNELADAVGTIMQGGNSAISFVIGGSYGLSSQVKSLCKLKLSMSPMTFPHQLARVMLLEQVYRGFQIMSNGKYHK